MAKALLALIAGTAVAAVVVAAIVAGSGTSAQGAGSGMSLKGYGDKAKTQLLCGSGAPMRKCGEVLLGDAFSIDVLASVIPPEGYTRFQIVLDFTDSVFNLQQQDGFAEVVWPDEGCDLVGGVETKDLGQYKVACDRRNAIQSKFKGETISTTKAAFLLYGDDSGRFRQRAGQTLSSMETPLLHRPRRRPSSLRHGRSRTAAGDVSRLAESFGGRVGICRYAHFPREASPRAASGAL